jgi:L-methionine (R)-S-oxide reductase
VSEKLGKYAGVIETLKRVIGGERDMTARMSSAACLLHGAFDHFLWTGFYRLQGAELVVGPYQGSLGCLRIALGKGVCGTAALEKSTVLVEDVHAFAGHIACDSRAKSEIVVPVFEAAGELIAVLDVDSDVEAAFDWVDKEALERVAAIVGGEKGGDCR